MNKKKKVEEPIKLEPLRISDLYFSNQIEDSCLNTSIRLEDYDWMNYVIKTKFNTLKYGVLNIKFEYIGTGSSFMDVELTRYRGEEEEKYEYHYDFNTNIFVDNLKEILLGHVNSWDSEFAFSGENLMLNFYNEVLEKGKLVG